MIGLRLRGEIEPGDKVRVDAVGDELKFEVEKGAAAQEVSSADADEMLAASLSEH